MDLDLSTLPALASSIYGDSTYMHGGAQIDSSTVLTPMALPRRDNNQMPLREQENAIDRVEKENFSLKLKIHFLEEALRKAGPGFSEATLKENTELKIDKVTLHRELQQHKKTLASAERDVDAYQKQISEMQQALAKKPADETQLQELLQEMQTKADLDEQNTEYYEGLEKRCQELEDLEQKLRHNIDLSITNERIAREAYEREIDHKNDEIEVLQDKIDILQTSLDQASAELRRSVGHKDNEIKELEDKVDVLSAELRSSAEHKNDEIKDLEDKVDILQASLDKASAELSRSTGHKDDEVKDLKDKVDVLSAELRSSAGHKNDEIKSLEDKVDFLQTNLDKASAELRRSDKYKDDEIKELEDKVDALSAELRRSARHKDDEIKYLEDKVDILQTSLDKASAELRRSAGHKDDEIKDLEDEVDVLQSQASILQSSLDRVSAELRHSVEQNKQHLEMRKLHVKELRGMSLQADWLRACCRREETFRASAAYAKRYMSQQIDIYQACNKADLRLLESTGLKSIRPKKGRKVTFRVAAWAVRATVRMKKCAEKWKQSTKVHDRLKTQARKQRVHSSSQQ